MTDLTPEMQAHIELTRAQASHSYKPRKIVVKPKKREAPEVQKPCEEADGDHSDST